MIQELKEALPYLLQFQDKYFIIKLGGKVVDENLENICEQITLLHKLGIKIIVVHGGSTQLEKFSKKIGVEQKKVNGSRITDNETLELTKMIYAGKVNIEIVAKLNKYKTSAIGLNGADGLLIKSTKRGIKKITNYATGEIKDVDFGSVGDIKSINVTLIEDLIQKNYLPVISCLGCDDDGNIYNINGDFVAKEIACLFKAEKLILLTSIDGVMKNQKLISYLELSKIDDLIKNKSATKGMIPKLSTCKEAVICGVKRVHILNGLKKDTLLKEVFTKVGNGTMIVSKDEYEYYEKEAGKIQ